MTLLLLFLLLLLLLLLFSRHLTTLKRLAIDNGFLA